MEPFLHKQNLQNKTTLDSAITWHQYITQEINLCSIKGMIDKYIERLLSLRKKNYAIFFISIKEALIK